MEREEAAKTGYDLISYAKYPPIQDYLKQANGQLLEAAALRYQKMLEDIGLTSGKVFCMAHVNLVLFFALLTRLRELMPELEFTGDYNDAIILEARATKDLAEIEEIRKMGRITVGVVQRVQDHLASHKVENETLIKEDGTPLTIGDVKSLINLWLAEAGAENPEATIFAIGRDGGIPHSAGTPEDPIQLGKSIVFDIFPCQGGGGYFYDFTRTWCLGYAPPEKFKKLTTRSSRSTIRSFPSSNWVKTLPNIRIVPVNYLKKWVMPPSAKIQPLKKAISMVLATVSDWTCTKNPGSGEKKTLPIVCGSVQSSLSNPDFTTQAKVMAFALKTVGTYRRRQFPEIC